MTVNVNGQPMELPDGLTVDGLLGHLKVRREFTAVALNREVWPRARFADTVLKDGDKVEIVRPMGGYRFPEHIRVTVGTMDENRKFIEALQKVIQNS